MTPSAEEPEKAPRIFVSRNSKDPEFRRLWDMPLGEFGEIESDPEHPLHAKALIVGREMLAPLAELIEAQAKPLQRELLDEVAEKLAPRIAPTEGFVERLGTLLWHNVNYAQEVSQKRKRRRDAALEAAAEASDLVRAGEPSAESTPAIVQDTADTLAREKLSELVVLQRAQLEHSKNESTKQDRRDIATRWVVWLTFGVAVATLIATIVVGLP